MTEKKQMKHFFHARHSCKDCMSISCQLDAVLAESSRSTWFVCDADAGQQFDLGVILMMLCMAGHRRTDWD